VQVIVFNDGERSLGVVVDQILDVAEDAVTVRQTSTRKGLLGSGVVGKKVADFLDLDHVIRAASADWFQSATGSTDGKRILVAEASAFSRGLIRSGLDMAGYRVLDAANLDEVIRGLEQHPVDVVVTALDLPPGGSSAVLAAMRRRPEWRGIPILALADSAEQIQQQVAEQADFQDWQLKFDRNAMLESVARLATALNAAEKEPVYAGQEQ
jgi:two-component system chemotaxis sensor kinase CheA